MTRFMPMASSMFLGAATPSALSPFWPFVHIMSPIFSPLASVKLPRVTSSRLIVILSPFNFSINRQSVKRMSPSLLNDIMFWRACCISAISFTSIRRSLSTSRRSYSYGFRTVCPTGIVSSSRSIVSSYTAYVAIVSAISSTSSTSCLSNMPLQSIS